MDPRGLAATTNRRLVLGANFTGTVHMPERVVADDLAGFLVRMQP